MGDKMLQKMVKNGVEYKFSPLFRTTFLNFYVNPSTGQDADGYGYTAAKPFKTIQAAATAAASPAQFYGVSLGAQINIAAGTYNESVHFPSLLGTNTVRRVYGAGQAETIINGRLWFDGWSYAYLDGVTVNVPVSGPSLYGIMARKATTLAVSNVTCRGAGGDIRGLLALPGGLIQIESGVKIIGSGQGAPLATDGGRVYLAADLTIEGAGAYAALAIGMGTIYRYSSAINILSPAGFTGRRYEARTGGQIHTNGGGPNFFPGTAAGAAVTAGVYD